MNFPRMIIAALALAVVSAPVFAGSKVYVCHNSDEGSHTIKISTKALKAHLGHGDTEGECPAIPVYKSVVMVRCATNLDGLIVVSGSSASNNAVLVPEGWNPMLGEPCSDTVAHLMNNGYSLDQTNSGGTDLGLETEYLFIGESNEPVVVMPPTLPE